MNPKFWADKRVLVTGAHGFLGHHLLNRSIHHGFWANAFKNNKNLQWFIPRSCDYDFRVWENCVNAVKDKDIVIHLAARAGGIGYNQKYPGILFYDNAIMGLQLMEASRQAGVEKFVAVGTVCGYPKHTPVPFQETEIWNGYPEETNAPYALAKKMLLIQAQAYRKQYGFNAIFLLPANLYGEYDHFQPDRSHVIPALIRKMLEAKDEVTLWGTGLPTREFLYAGDCADAILLATEHYDGAEPVNIGACEETSILDLAVLIRELTDFGGLIMWDTSKPDGQPRRCLDTTRAKEFFGFEATTPLRDGLTKTIDWYRAWRNYNGNS